ncbi:MAG: 4Fe-4S dicluster domain-containing protein [Actinobacteria bacterium]|nr:4Fe-4S dicluster domain-containing protein [Actinomycetota bacterium]
MWGTGLINGLRISFRNMLRGPITVKYPYERLELPERARWAVRPKYFGDGTPKCTACLTCVKTCPDHILSLDVETRDDKSKRIARFGYEIGACMMCGLCVEACPFDAIRMSHEYELAVTDASGLMEYLLTEVDAATNARHKAEKEAEGGGEADE